jgi:hypothetical protein
MKVEKLTVELSLANDSIGKLTKKHFSVNDIIASLKNEKSIAQKSLTSLEEKYRNLELNYSTLWASTSTSSKATEDSNVSTSNDCKRFYKIDVNTYATNLVELEKKDKEIQRLKMILKNGCKCQEQSNNTIYKSSRQPSIKEGIGYNRYDEKSNGRNMVNGVPCVKFNKGVALDELIFKANNKVYILKIAPTSDKTIKTKQVEAPKPQAPLPRCYASDYMCCWDKDDKIMVKYVGAQKRKEIMRSVWVPKFYVTNLLGPKSFGYLNPKLDLSL